MKLVSMQKYSISTEFEADKTLPRTQKQASV